MTRSWIRQGDSTTSQGVVLTGLATMTHDGLPMAFEGDSVSCPACKSTGVIQCVGERIPFKGPHGREAALEGDLCICRCTPPPRLVAGQRSATSEGWTAYAEKDDHGFFAGRDPYRAPDPAQRRFLVVDQHSGEPLPNRRYRLTYPGGVAEGRTDADGQTEWVSGVDGDEITIEVFAEGA
ncbi:MAG: PAAR domain-containing protein [Burkholderiaceae bacterium]|nr:PAAR domain-containing protein [Burkholderiaceae bacterium]